MPGYPRVDKASDYLIARFDGVVVDGKPWGRGALEGASTAESLGYQKEQAGVLTLLLSLEVRNPHSQDFITRNWQLCCLLLPLLHAMMYDLLALQRALPDQ